MKKKKLTKAVIYVRSSVNEPAQHIEDQIFACLHYCKANDLVIVDCVTEIGSTVDKSRQGLKRLLSLIRDKAVDAIVVTSFNRIHRKFNSTVAFMNRIIEQDVELHTLDKGTDYDEIVTEAFCIEIGNVEKEIISQEESTRSASKKTIPKMPTKK